MPPTDRWSKWTKKQNHKPSNLVPHFTKPAKAILLWLEDDVQAAKDNLLLLKITQGSKKITSPNRNLTWSWWPGHALQITLPIRIPTERPKPCCKIYALVWWTFHHHRCLPTCSAYTTVMPNVPKTYPSFHTSLLKPFAPNNVNLFLSWIQKQPGTVVTDKG